MEISERAHYGLRAMTELAKAYGQGPLPLTRIAEVEHLPAGYLEQLAMPLRRAGLIAGTRGAHGGYKLVCPPSQVTVGAVMRALEGPIAPVECLTEAYVGGACDREGACVSQSLWQRVKFSVDRVLESVTLADLCMEGQDAPFISIRPAPQVLRGDACAVDL